MSAPIKIQAAIFCGGRHDMPRSLSISLGTLKRSEYDNYARGYAEGRGWTARNRAGTVGPSLFGYLSGLETARILGASSNDWRCPDCTKAGAS